MKHWLIYSAVIVVILTSGGWALKRWYDHNLLPVTGSNVGPTLFEIEPGTSSLAITRNLAADHLIRNRLAFSLYLFGHGYNSHMQAGLYRLDGSLPATQIAQIITSGQTAVVTFSITPGERLDQIKTDLLAKGYSKQSVSQALALKYPYSILKDKPARASLEGYLFPDTYRIEIDKPVYALIDLILANTDQKISSDIRAGWAAQGLNLHQGLTLASIVVKETANPDDQKQVAQVYLKRLKIGMKLESDPTFIYAAAILNQSPSVSINSAYNTYLHKGLPPTPIGAIDLDAAQAVANPAHTNWLYFLADKAGITHFATTEAEHKRNIEKYLR